MKLNESTECIDITETAVPYIDQTGEGSVTFPCYNEHAENEIMNKLLNYRMFDSTRHILSYINCSNPITLAGETSSADPPALSFSNINVTVNKPPSSIHPYSTPTQSQSPKCP